MTKHTPLGKPQQTWVRAFSRSPLSDPSQCVMGQMPQTAHLAHGTFAMTVRAEDIRAVMPPFQPQCEGYLVITVKGIKGRNLMALRDELVKVFPTLAATYP